MREDGVRTIEYVIESPAFFPNAPAVLDARAAAQTVRVPGPLKAPVTAAATLSYEWRVTRSVSAALAYTHRRDYRLLRSRNISVLPVTGATSVSGRIGPLLQFESTGRGEANELRATLRRSLTRVSVFGTYVRRSALSDSDGPYSVPSDSTSLQGEYGRAGDDERYRLIAGATVSLPREWYIHTLFTYGSGRPFNITSGVDANGDLLYTDRPSAGSPGAAGVVDTPLGAFDVSPAGEPMIQRNAGQGPSYLAVTAGLAKKIRLGGPGPAAPYVTFSVSAENLTNRSNYADFNGVVTSPLFGAAHRALDPFRVEFNARVGF